MKDQFDTSKVTNKEARRITEALRQAGHQLSWAGSGHIKIRHKSDGAVYTLPSTPSDSNWARQAIRDLRAQGFLYTNPLIRGRGHNENNKIGHPGTPVEKAAHGDPQRQEQLRKLLQRQLPNFENRLNIAARRLVAFGQAEGLRLTKSEKPTNVITMESGWRVKLQRLLQGVVLDRWVLDTIELWLYSLDYAEENAVEVDLTSEVTESEFQKIVDAAIEEDTSRYGNHPTYRELQEELAAAKMTNRKLTEQIMEMSADRMQLRDQIQNMAVKQNGGHGTPYWVRLAETLMGKVDAETFAALVREAHEVNG